METIDLLTNRVEAEIGVRFLSIAAFSANRQRRPATLADSGPRQT